MSRHAHASFRSAWINLGTVLAGLMVATFGSAAHASLLPLPTLTGGGSLVLRLDANAINGDGNPNPTDGASISTWTDLSTNGNDATQAASIRQPIYMANQTPNSSGAVQFNGSSAFLLDPATISGPTTWFIVYNSQGAPTVSGTLMSLPSSDPATSAATYDQVVLLDAGGYQNVTVVADGNSATTVGINPAFDSSSHLLAFDYNGSGEIPANFQMSYDLANTIVNTSGTSTFSFTQPDGTIGQRGQDASFYNGNISAILVYSGNLNSTDYNAVQSYLDKEFLVAPEPASLGLVAVGGVMLLRRRQNVYRAAR